MIDTSGLPFQKPIAAEGRKKLSKTAYKALRKQVYSEQGRRCAACSHLIWVLSDAHLHHKSLRKMGGGSRDDSRSNVEILCSRCHRKEHNQ